MKSKRTRGIITIAALTFLATGSVLGLIQLNPVIFPDIGRPTSTYDCDDGVLDMYRHFEKLSVESIPVVGNLEMKGETYTQSNHVWLMVMFGGRLVAYDWGTPRFDKQHYEGYKINLDYLLYVVQQDKKDPDLLPIADN